FVVRRRRRAGFERLAAVLRLRFVEATFVFLLPGFPAVQLTISGMVGLRLRCLCLVAGARRLAAVRRLGARRGLVRRLGERRRAGLATFVFRVLNAIRQPLYW